MAGAVIYNPEEGYDSEQDYDINPNVQRIQYEFDNAVNYDEKNRERSYENWRMYWAIDHGQWPEGIQQQYTREGRHMGTYNIVGQKVDALAGALGRNPYDIDFLAIEEGDANLTLALKEAMYSDKELLDWRRSENQCMIDGLIYLGVEEMVISNKYHELGNIGFERLLPGHVVFDPHWKSNNASDCKKAWKIAFLTAHDIMRIYGTDNEDLRSEIHRTQNMGFQYQDAEGPMPYSRDIRRSYYGNLLRVVEEYTIVEVEKTMEIYLGDERILPEWPEEADKNFKIDWMNEQYPDGWDPKWIVEQTKMEKVCYITAICPDLSSSVVLADGPHEIQIGRLPFFPFSASRAQGEWRGIVDSIKDVQLTINARESLVTHIMQTSANGSMLVDPLLFDSDQSKIDEFIANRNNPSYVGTTAPGKLNQGMNPMTVKTSSFNSEIISQIQRMYDVADRISKAPAAADARTEGAGESGILFERKARMAEQQQFVLMENLRQHINDKGEAYLFQAKQTYARGAVPREFSLTGKKDRITLNKRSLDEWGEESIENDISKLSRHRVIVSQSPEGENKRLLTRAVSVDLIQSAPPESMGIRQKLFQKVTESVDVFNDEEKTELKQIGESEFGLAMAKMEAETANMQLTTLQAKMQAKQLMDQFNQGQPQGQGPGGELPSPDTSGGKPPAAPEEGALAGAGAIPAGQPIEGAQTITQ